MDRSQREPEVISDSYTSMFRDKLSTHIWLIVCELHFVYVCVCLLLSFGAHAGLVRYVSCSVACDEWIGPQQCWNLGPFI